MKTHCHIANEDLSEYFKLALDGKEYYFSQDLTVEYDDRSDLRFDLEIVHAQAYFRMKMKNPLLRGIINLFKWILFAVIYFVDNHNGIGLHKGYFGFDPSAAKCTCTIPSPHEKTVTILYTKGQYNKTTMRYAPSVMEVQGEGLRTEAMHTAFSTTALVQEWNTYHVPAFTLIMAVMAALCTLMGYACIKVFAHLSSSEESQMLSALGTVLCTLAVLAMLLWFVRTLIKAHRLKKQVIKNNTAE